MKTKFKFTLLLVMLICLLWGCGGPSVDLKQYVEVEFTGAHGYGRGEVYLHGDPLAAEIAGEEEAAYLDAYLLLEQLHLELDMDQNLSNGDTVTVTVTYPEEQAKSMGVRLSPKSGESWTVKVSDLPEMQVLDIFAAHDVSFSGYDGYGSAQVTGDNDYDFRCNLSQTEGLSNGDTVTLTLTAPGQADLAQFCMESYGFVPARTVKEYTVSGLEIPGQVDLFEDIDITVEGYSPYLSISVLGKYDRQNISYTLENGDDNGILAIGDTVTIRASANRNDDLTQLCLKKLGALPISDTYTYTIGTDHSKFVLQPEDLDDATMNYLISEAKDIFDSLSKDDDITFKSVTYHSAYLQTAKRYSSWRACNCVHILHEVTYVLDGKEETHYNAVLFTNVILDEAGNCHYDTYENPYGWRWGTGVTTIYAYTKKYITPDAAKYHCVEIPAGQ